MKDCLMKWSERNADTPEEPARFISTLRHIKDVYKYLQDNLPPKDLQDLLRVYNAIFYPSTLDAVDNLDKLIEGKFLGRWNNLFHSSDVYFIQQ